MKRGENYFYKILVILLIVVLVLGLFDYFNNLNKKDISGDVVNIDEIKQLIDKSSTRFQIELDIPEYLPEYLKHPQKIFSGRKIKIIDITDSENKVKSDYSSEIKLSKRDKLKKNLISETIIGVEKQKKERSSFIIKLPDDMETGYYTLEFQKDSENFAVPIDVQGLTTTESSQLSTPSMPTTLDSSVLSTKRLECGSCFWESVLGMNPINENYQYFIGASSDFLVQTKDSWKTSQIFHINELTNPLLMGFRGDPKIAFTYDGKFVLTSLLFQNYSEPITGGIYQDSSSINFPPQLEQIILKPTLDNLDPSVWLIFDYPKIAIDNYPGSPYFKSIYVSANADYDAIAQSWGTGFYIVKDGTITRRWYDPNDWDNFVNTPNSIVVDSKGIIYFGRDNTVSKVVYYSQDGGNSFNKNIIRQPDNGSCTGLGRVSLVSNRSWVIYSGLELALDQNSSRLYASWAEYKKCIEDPSFEYASYGYDFDVFVSFSDDNARTWSSPVKVNDDNSGGDQGFPSIKIDENGVVYVTFLDHRENQDKEQYDAYYAYSSDGGLTFSKNIRINDISVPNVYGGRNPGDYLDMLAVGKDKVFVSHPCVNSLVYLGGNANDACISILSKSDPNKVYIKNSQTQNVAWFGDRGNIVLKGTCQVQSNCLPPQDSFILKNANNEVVSYIDSQGNLCIETGDCSSSTSCTLTTNDEFVMKDETGRAVSKIDLTNGDLCLTGKLIENAAWSMLASEPQCNDWIDNNGNNLIDMSDPGCSDLQDNDEKPYCTDSDGGRDYGIKGETFGQVNCGANRCGQSTVADKCENNVRLDEFYCGNDGYVYVDLYDCPKGCLDGACKT